MSERKEVSVGAKPPAGAYSRGIVVGNLLFISGQVPRSFETGELLGASVAEQTHAVIDNLVRVLEAAGASLADLVAVTAYLQDIGAWEEFDRAYRERLPSPYPTRTTLGANLHGVLVEISAIAVVP